MFFLGGIMGAARGVESIGGHKTSTRFPLHRGFVFDVFFHFGRDQVLIAVSWSHQTVKRINNWFVDFNLSVLSVVLDRLYCHPGTGYAKAVCIILQ